MLIGGLQKFSLTDYPGKVSAIIYTQGCNFRCGFCYNSELISYKPPAVGYKLEEKDVIDFLKSRVGKLDAAVITGGEPTIHNDLPEFIKKIKEMGFDVGLFTNGSNPAMLGKLIAEKLVGYVSMDVKTRITDEPSVSFDKVQDGSLRAGKGQKTDDVQTSYEKVVGVKVDLDKIKRSIGLLKNSDIDYRIATTVVPGLVTLDDVRALAPQISGVKCFVIQPLVKTKEMLDNKYKDAESYSIGELKKLRDEIAHYFGKCEVRS